MTLLGLLLPTFNLLSSQQGKHELSLSTGKTQLQQTDRTGVTQLQQICRRWKASLQEYLQQLQPSHSPEIVVDVITTPAPIQESLSSLVS
jgi:hypothetical protein